MTTHKIRRDDEVIVISGKDKGKRGRVKCVFYNKNKVIVSGVNIIKKHQKPVPDKNQSGGIIQKEAPVDLSNVAIFNSVLNKSDRVTFKIENRKKIRIFKSNKSIIK